MLTYEELETVLCEIEESINNRPLMYQSEDDFGQAVTPFHFWTDLRNNQREPTTVSTDTIDDCFKRLRCVQKAIADQWKRFQKTYLNELRQHHIYRKTL